METLNGIIVRAVFDIFPVLYHDMSARQEIFRQHPLERPSLWEDIADMKLSLNNNQNDR